MNYSLAQYIEKCNRRIVCVLPENQRRPPAYGKQIPSTAAQTGMVNADSRVDRSTAAAA